VAGERSLGPVVERSKQGRCRLRTDEEGRAGSLVALACETRYVAATEEFGELLDGLSELVLVQGLSSVEELLDEGWRDGGTVRGAITATSLELQENLTVVGVRSLAVDGGYVGGYVHHNEWVGVLAAVRTAAQREDAEAFLGRLGMHVAAFPPTVLSRGDFAPERIEYETGGYLLEVRDEPEGLREAWVQSRLARFYAEHCLLDQRWVLDESQTVAQAALDALGEGTEIVDYARLAVRT